MPGSAAVPVCGVSGSGVRGGRYRGRLRRVPHDPAGQHHAHGPDAWTDVETTTGMFDQGRAIHDIAKYPAQANLMWLLPLISQGAVVAKSQDRGKPRTGKDIARVTFDLYRMSPKDVFGSLSVKATFQGLYSVSANFECLGPKKILRWEKGKGVNVIANNTQQRSFIAEDKNSLKCSFCLLLICFM